MGVSIDHLREVCRHFLSYPDVPSNNPQLKNSLEGVSTARGDLLAGAALPDASHLALGGVLAAEGARVLGVLGDLWVGKKQKTREIRDGERGNRGRKAELSPMFVAYKEQLATKRQENSSAMEEGQRRSS